MSPDRNLFTIDAHAHIAPDVSGPQLQALGNTVVLAMTRSLTEARAVYRRRDPSLIWGVGTHPAAPEALDEYDPDTFSRALDHFSVVGEVGLDRRGQVGHQRDVFASILQQCQGKQVVISVHSTGRIKQTLEIIEEYPHPGLILHWFNGTFAEIQRAVELGCYFSINAAMSPDKIEQMPVERMLTETDFPSSRKRTQASKPGDTVAAEALLGRVLSKNDARMTVHENLRRLFADTGVSDRLRPGGMFSI